MSVVALTDVVHLWAAFGMVIKDPDLTKLDVTALELNIFKLDANRADTELDNAAVAKDMWHMIPIRKM